MLHCWNCMKTLAMSATLEKQYMIYHRIIVNRKERWLISS